VIGLGVFATMEVLRAGPGDPAITVVSPTEGQLVASGVVVVQFDVQNFTIGALGSPHLHFYLDGDPTVYEFINVPGCNGDLDCVSYLGVHTHFVHWRDSSSIQIFGLAAGQHQIRFVLADASDQELTNPEATVTRIFNVSQPPSGEFELQSVISGLNFPTRMAFAPDGRLFFTEKTGRVRIIDPGWQLRAQPFYEFAVDSGGEKGLLGMTLDPNFATNGYIYFQLTSNSPPGNKVVRLTDTNNLGTSETTLIDGFPGDTRSTCCHVGGALRIGPDGKLYISIGEINQASGAQNVNFLGGKVLRLNTDGSIPTDNPFAGSPVYALGLRNPFGSVFHPHTGDLWITENGPSSDDEINRIVAAGNYGWPNVTGIAGNPSFIDPIIEMTPTISPTGIAAVGEDSAYPEEYHDNLLYVAWNDGTIRRIRLAGAELDQLGSVTTAFNGGEGGLIHIVEGPDGFMYVNTTSEIFRVTLGPGGPQPTNQPPAVNAGDDLTILLPMSASLNGSVADDGLILPVSINWSKVSGPGTVTFGSPNAAVTSATLSGAGTYVLRLTANDGEFTVTDDVTVTANEGFSVFSSTFVTDTEGFAYADDTFRSTAQPGHESGGYAGSSGFPDGALRVLLGGVDDNSVLGMSGGWGRQFALPSDTEATLSFHYKLTQAPNYENDEWSEVLVSLDGVLVGSGGADYVVRIVGDGNGGSEQTTGWQTFQVNLGILSAGTRALTIGGYNNKKTASDESTEVLIDNVVVIQTEEPIQISCDLDSDGFTNVIDVQLGVNQGLGRDPCGNADLDQNSLCNVIDVQRLVNAALGLGCRIGP
jgi:glucose/arabinose dehydrogenase